MKNYICTRNQEVRKSQNENKYSFIAITAILGCINLCVCLWFVNVRLPITQLMSPDPLEIFLICICNFYSVRKQELSLIGVGRLGLLICCQDDGRRDTIYIIISQNAGYLLEAMTRSALTSMDEKDLRLNLCSICN